MNVDIFACIHFHEFRKSGNFTWIFKIRVSMTFGLCRLYEKLFSRYTYFRGKYLQREYFYVYSTQIRSGD